MQKKKDIKGLLGPWNDKDIKNKFTRHDHKFFDRNRTLKINWGRLHDKIPHILLNDKSLKVLDVASGNGATMEVLRYYGHKVQGMDFSPGFKSGDWLYRPLIESQGLRCKVHDGASLPYPYKDNEFDFVICYGAITFFKPVENWPKVLDEFQRISKRGILLGVNNGKVYDAGKKYVEGWKSSKFKKTLTSGSIYRWDLK